MIEIYNLALLNWWRDRLSWRDRPVPLIFSTPQRAFADMEQLLDRSRGDSGTALNRDGNIPLPFCSMSLTGIEEYDGSRDNAGVIRGMYVKSDLSEGINVDWPTPVKLPYQIDFWCETQNQKFHFVDQVRRLFKLLVTYIEIDFASPFWDLQLERVPDETKVLGRRQVAINNSGWSDTSNLEPGDQLREIRATFSFEVNAWMARGFSVVPLARRIVTHIQENTDGEVLCSFAVEGTIDNNGD